MYLVEISWFWIDWMAEAKRKKKDERENCSS
jgi:hypothetical protein